MSCCAAAASVFRNPRRLRRRGPQSRQAQDVGPIHVRGLSSQGGRRYLGKAAQTTSKNFTADSSARPGSLSLLGFARASFFSPKTAYLHLHPFVGFVCLRSESSVRTAWLTSPQAIDSSSYLNPASYTVAPAPALRASQRTGRSRSLLVHVVFTTSEQRAPFSLPTYGTAPPPLSHQFGGDPESGTSSSATTSARAAGCRRSRQSSCGQPRLPSARSSDSYIRHGAERRLHVLLPLGPASCPPSRSFRVTPRPPNLRSSRAAGAASSSSSLLFGPISSAEPRGRRPGVSLPPFAAARRHHAAVADWPPTPRRRICGRCAALVRPDLPAELKRRPSRPIHGRA